MANIEYQLREGWTGFSGGTVNLGGDTIDIASMLTAGDGTIVVDGENPTLAAILDAYPALIRVGGTEEPAAPVYVTGPLVVRRVGQGPVDLTGAPAGSALGVAGDGSITSLGPVVSRDEALPTVVSPHGLRRWRAAIADALGGQAVINVLGDSISVGVGADGQTGTPDWVAVDPTYRSSGWVGQLRRLFAVQYGDPGEGFLLPVFNTGQVGSNITFTGTDTGFHASSGPRAMGCRATNGGTITYALPACTAVDVWTWDGGSGLSASIAVDGGAPTTFTAGIGSAGKPLTYTKRTISGLSAGTHTLVVTGPATGVVYVAAVVTRRSESGVLVNRLSRSGDTSANLVGRGQELQAFPDGQQRNIVAQVRSPRADLCVVPLGTNDYGAQNNRDPATNVKPGSTPDQYEDNLRTFVTEAVNLGACVLLVGEPRANNVPSPLNWTEAEYFARMAKIAADTDHVAYVDIGEVWGTNAQGNTLGLYSGAGSVHPSRRGHGDIARTIHRVLSAPVGPA